jgi:hypothetical protein
VSEPALDAPAIELLTQRGPGPGSAEGGVASGKSGVGPGYVFLAPIKDFAYRSPFVGKPGPEILEANGDPVWQHPLGEPIKVGRSIDSKVAMNFHATSYAGQPVLVWWEGYVTPLGLGNGEWEIVNDHYQAVGKIKAPAGFELDFHELRITPTGNAYILANRIERLSLHCCRGPAKGELYDPVVMEVNIRTGRVVWRWDPLRHVPLRDSYQPLPRSGPWDPYHLNSISFGPSGNLIVSARNTWAAYWINRTSRRDNGQVFATLGGKHSTLRLGPGAHFAWQHNVLQQQNEQVSLFDDEAAPTEGRQSRGLLLALDFAHRVATVLHQYLLPHEALTGSQGNVQVLPSGNVFVGWGELPYFSEYGASGQLLYESKLPTPDESYRSFRAPWTGLPTGGPAIAARAASGAADIYASWNGATEVASWQLLAGASPASLAASGAPMPREGFETTIATASAGPYYAVQAIDDAGRVLGTSPAVTLSGQAASKLRAAERR